MHRLIMLSSAYRASSLADAREPEDRPGESLLLAHEPPAPGSRGAARRRPGGGRNAEPESRRTAHRRAAHRPKSRTACAIRRSGLFRAIRPTYTRRSVYLLVKRSFQLPMLEAFDAPDSTASCARRDVSTVAPQALALMNGKFMLAQAGEFAKRLRANYGASPEATVDGAWQVAFGRPPSPTGKDEGSRVPGIDFARPLLPVGV